MSPEERGIYCVKGYGNIQFVGAGTTAFCPISGTRSCVECHVVTAEQAKEGKQVKPQTKE